MNTSVARKFEFTWYSFLSLNCFYVVFLFLLMQPGISDTNLDIMDIKLHRVVTYHTYCSLVQVTNYCDRTKHKLKYSYKVEVYSEWPMLVSQCRCFMSPNISKLRKEIIAVALRSNKHTIFFFLAFSLPLIKMTWSWKKEQMIVKSCAFL